MHETEPPKGFAAWLQDRLGDRTQGQVAEYVGVAKSTVNRWLSGHSFPERRSIRRLASYLKVSEGEIEALLPDGPAPRVPLDELIGGMTREIAELRAAVESNVQPGRIAQTTSEAGELPWYAWGAAGDPTGDEPPEPAGYTRPADEIGKLSPAAFGVRVRGDSMVGEGINDGDLVWIEPGPCRPPCAVLAHIEGMNGHDSGMVVKLYKRDGYLYGHSTEGESIVACKERTIIGPVVGVQNARRLSWGR